MVWCGVVRYGVVWCSVLKCGEMWCGVVWWKVVTGEGKKYRKIRKGQT